MTLDSPIPVALLGATGAVGQRFAHLLNGHPWFRLAEVVASPGRRGQRYGDALLEEGAWMVPGPSDPLAAVGAAADLVLVDSTTPLASPLVFSALHRDQAIDIERRLADAGHFVVSNASAHRMEADVPIVVPEVNAHALERVQEQTSWVRSRGALVTNSNCTTAGLVLALAPIEKRFGLEAVSATTMQALSGAGRAGLVEPRMTDDMVPFIPGEEEKMRHETCKIFDAEHPRPYVTAMCTRVPVIEGHTMNVSVKTVQETNLESVRDALETFRSVPQELELPSAPLRPVHVHNEPDAPRPKRVRDLDKGMATHVGRLHTCGLFDWGFIAVTHNTVRGAAGGSILIAELAVSRGFVGGSRT